jgi:hypothetical protein
MKELEMNFKLQPLEVGHSKFEGRTFEQGKTVAAAVIS